MINFNGFPKPMVKSVSEIGSEDQIELFDTEEEAEALANSHHASSILGYTVYEWDW